MDQSARSGRRASERPAPAPVPKEVDWESWIGPAPMRDYADGAYHDFRWRGWWDFGTGSLGDMACHTCNLPFMALNMRNPTAVEATSSPNNQDSYPRQSKITFEFPELDGRPAFTLHWSDKSQLPPEELYAEFLEGKTDSDGKPQQLSESGCLIVGDKCTMYAAGDYAQDGIELSGGVEWIERRLSQAPSRRRRRSGAVARHRVLQRDPRPASQTAMSNIPDYAGPLTETILLGNLALWKGGSASSGTPRRSRPDDPSLAKIVQPEYRDGYEV